MNRFNVLFNRTPEFRKTLQKISPKFRTLEDNNF